MIVSGFDLKSSNYDVVSITSERELEAKGLGTATVTVTDKYSRTKEIKVTVKEKQTTLNIIRGKYDTYEEVSFDATKSKTVSLSYSGDQKDLTVTSSDEKIVSAKWGIVYSSSFELELTPLKKGSEVVTDSDNYGRKITISVVVDFELKVDKSALNVSFDAMQAKTVSFNYTGNASVLTVTSSDENIVNASLAGGTYVLLTPKKNGSATVTIKDGSGSEINISVEVSVAMLNETSIKFDDNSDINEKTLELKAGKISSIEGGGDIVSVEYKPGDTSFKVVAKNNGNAQLVVTNDWGEKETLQVTVSVTDLVIKEKKIVLYELDD